MASQCASEACSRSPIPLLRGWLLSREATRSFRGRGSSSSWQRQRQRQSKGREEARGAPMHAAPRTSLLLSQPLPALILGHPHRVRMASG